MAASLCAGQQRAVRAQVHGVLLLQLGDRGGEGAGPRPAGSTHPGLPLASQGIVLRLDSGRTVVPGIRRDGHRE